MANLPHVKVYFDGGCRPAPAGMETAVVIRGLSYLQPDLGPGTSMEAEWLALIRAVEMAHELGLSSPLFLGDALAVIRQAVGAAKCKGSSVRHYETLQAISTSSPPLHIRHVKRTQNLAGIALARLHDR
jgi:ribonuclease HI